MSHAKVLAIEVDGGSEIEAVDSDSVGIIYPGERVDLVIHWTTGAAHIEPGFRITLDEEYDDTFCKELMKLVTDSASGTSPIQIRLLSLHRLFPFPSLLEAILVQPEAFRTSSL